MIFTSLKFILFISAVFIGYFIFPKRYRWIWLLISSYCFYFSASIKYGFYLVFSTISTYIAALAIGKITERFSVPPDMGKEEKKALRRKNDRKKKLVVAAAVLINFGILFFIKYYNFSVLSLAKFTGLFGFDFSPHTLSLVLPVGISFYTFQVIGYIIDVYRGVCDPQKNFFKYALFASYFPQIMQGPIGRYQDLVSGGLFEGRSFDYDRAMFGLQRMTFGFFEKLVIADRLAIAVNTVWADYASYGKAEIIFACILYAIQIYADFAGYMDIALGASEVMGIKMAENFDAPYFAASVPEFWRRWHMTLGSWFREYLFYPVMRSGWCSALGKKLKKSLGKGVSSKTTTVIALLCVWFFTGLWHGSSWHYVAWGVYYGILIILSMLLAPLFDKAVDKLSLDRERPSYKLVQILKTFALVCVGYVLFRSDSLSQAKGIFMSVLSPAVPLSTPLGIGLDAKDLKVALVAVAVLFAVDLFRYKKIDPRSVISKQGLWLRWIIYFAFIFAVLIYGIYGPGYSSASFIYFQF